jgi:hypothetical protein
MALKKFSSQAEAEILIALGELARTEGKQMQALINEAFADLLEKRKRGTTRRHVMEAFQSSLREYDSVYETLAK